MKIGGSRALWSLSIPLLFAEVSEIVLHVSDTIFLARVGVPELGAVGLADSAIDISLVLALGLVDGIQILTARQIGRGRPRRAVALFNLGLWITVGLSVVLALLLATNAGLIAGWLAESEAVSVAVEDFLRIASLGSPFTAACFAYSALLVAFGRTRVLVPATIILAVTNATFDYILIFGKLGFAPMGIQGAAIGSVGAEIVTFLFLTYYLMARSEARLYGLFLFTRFGRKPLKRLIALSAPISLQGLVEGVRWLVFFLILERVGAVALAVANVVYACYEVLRIPTEAFGEAACSMVSNLIGRNRTERIESVVHGATQAAGLVTLPLLAFAFVAPEWILSVFALDDGLLQAGSASLRVVAVAMLVVVPAEMWHTAVLGTGDTAATLAIESLLTLVMLGATYVAAISLSGSLALVWASLGIAWMVALVASYGWMKSGIWRRLAY